MQGSGISGFVILISRSLWHAVATQSWTFAKRQSQLQQCGHVAVLSVCFFVLCHLVLADKVARDGLKDARRQGIVHRVLYTEILHHIRKPSQSQKCLEIMRPSADLQLGLRAAVLLDNDNGVTPSSGCVNHSFVAFQPQQRHHLLAKAELLYLIWLQFWGLLYEQPISAARQCSRPLLAKAVRGLVPSSRLRRSVRARQIIQAAAQEQDAASSSERRHYCACRTRIYM
mmetsp:Transcript_3799/g.8470  ORF Transcript_3799/g.8470 Transcript_3799/m.8470 type:complete len:228 (-) Transcript_3799:224-907(-)